MVKILANPWDLIADKYDKQFGDEGDYSHKYIIYPALLNELKSATLKKKNIIDLGCGTGTLTRILYKLSANVVGLDFSKEMINFATKRNAIGKDKYYIHDLRKKIPFNTSSFDIVIASMVLHSIEDKFMDRVIKEIHRILKPSAMSYIVIPHPFFVREFRSLEEDDDRQEYYLTNHKTRFKWKQFAEICDSPTDFYLRPLQYYVNSFTTNGFLVEKVFEPQIINSFEAYKAKPYNYDRRREIPGFMILKLVKSEYDSKK